MFDAHDATRVPHSSKGGFVFRNVKDPNEIAVLIEFSDIEKARQLLQSDDLREAMMKSGIIGLPEISLLNEDDRPPG